MASETLDPIDPRSQYIMSLAPSTADISLPIAPTDTRELNCMELIGGNRTAHEAYKSPGLDVWLESQPHEGSVGGDVYYFSVCGSGRVTRLAIGDISGHGQVVDNAAMNLRQLMRKHINLLDQTDLARTLNRDFLKKDHAEHFATILLLTYFAPTDHLIVCNGGHPPPLWYSTRQQRWQPLTCDLHDKGAPIQDTSVRYRMRRVSNLPLGVIEPTAYNQFAVKLDEGDLVLLYTDELVEAHNDQGDILDEQGLLDFVREMDVSAPQDLIGNLLQRIDQWRGDRPRNDDQTVILLHHNASAPPRLTLGKAVNILAKMIGLKKV